MFCLDVRIVLGVFKLLFTAVEAFQKIGFVKNISDLENAVITARDNVPIYVKNVARVVKGPALRRGGLEKEGDEAVGGGDGD